MIDIQQVKKELQLLDARWHKLLFIPATVDKKIAEQIDIPLVNLNVLISERLKEIAKSKWPLQVGEIISKHFEEVKEDTVWLSSIEILFDPQLQQNPVRLLEQLSRRHKLVVSWPGEISESGLSYAVPDHPEYFVCRETEGKTLKV